MLVWMRVFWTRNLLSCDCSVYSEWGECSSFWFRTNNSCLFTVETERNLIAILVQHHFFVEYFLHFWHTNFLKPLFSTGLRIKSGCPHFMNFQLMLIIAIVWKFPNSPKLQQLYFSLHWKVCYLMAEVIKQCFSLLCVWRYSKRK